MTNELIFLFHATVLLAATLAAFSIHPVLLQALVCTQIVCANIFVIRQMTLLGLHACGGGMYIVGSMCGLLLLQTFYGQKAAHTTLRLSIVCALAFVGLSQFQLWYTPAPGSSMHDFFVILLGRVPRITIASIGAHYLSHYVSLRLASMLHRITSYAWLAQSSALFVGQVLDSVVFFTGSFLGYAPLVHIMQMVVVSMAIKGSMIALSSLLLACAARIAPGRRYDFW